MVPLIENLHLMKFCEYGPSIIYEKCYSIFCRFGQKLRRLAGYEETSRSNGLLMSQKIFRPDLQNFSNLYFTLRRNKLERTAVNFFPQISNQIGLYHSLNGVTNTNYRLLRFLTNVISFPKRRRH
jgi:hypothetical protein